MNTQHRDGAASHSFEDHTGEVLLHLSAPGLAALLSEAGRALGELQSDDPPGSLEDNEHVVLRASDRATLLVDWLNELIFLSETRKRIYSEFAFETANSREVVARVRGWTPTHLRTQVKAATLHRLSVTEGSVGLKADVVLDV